MNIVSLIPPGFRCYPPEVVDGVLCCVLAETTPSFDGPPEDHYYAIPATHRVLRLEQASHEKCVAHESDHALVPWDRVPEVATC